jgi:TIR domain/CHASE2 domain
LAEAWRRSIAAIRSALTGGIPSWIRQTVVLVVIYVVVMVVLTVWVPVWHEWDWNFFQWVSSMHRPTLSPAIALVDIRSWDPDDIAVDRRTVAAFLDRLVDSTQRPKAVILDIDFGPCQTKPCGAPLESARAALVQSLEHAARAGISVYAAEGMVIDQSGGSDDASGIDPHDPLIYAVLSGVAHTHFVPVPGSSGLLYRVCYSIPVTEQSGNPIRGQSEQAVWSMAWRVLPDFDTTQPCDTEHLPVRFGALVAPLGQTGDAIMSAPAGYFITSERVFPSGANFDNRYLIIGTVRCDRPLETAPCGHPQDLGRSGPEIVAWALSDVLEGEGPRNPVQARYEARPQNGMLLLFLPAFAALIVLAFTAWYFLLRRLQLRGLRRFLPWMAAVLGLGLGFAVFAGFEAWMLWGGMIQPQVTLISLSMVVAAALCAVRGNQIEWELRNVIDVTATQEKYDYDVFISYAHDELAWVLEHVYDSFRSARLPGDKKLSIFFDTSTIRVGTAWQDKISLAIDASKFIVPVYSDTYFQRPYCRFEIRRAHRKWINEGEQSRCVLPIMRGHPVILKTVDDIQAVSFDDEPDVVERIVAEIVERLS